VSKVLLSPIEAITQIVSIGLLGRTRLMRPDRWRLLRRSFGAGSESKGMRRGRQNWRQLPISGGTKKPVDTLAPPRKPQICHNVLIRFQFISKARILPRLAVRFPGLI
jgi:hypothetical protein